jgi:hypothetical protein
MPFTFLFSVSAEQTSKASCEVNPLSEAHGGEAVAEGSILRPAGRRMSCFVLRQQILLPAGEEKFSVFIMHVIVGRKFK